MDIVRFFNNKRPWSRYKDLILDYYLAPYLYKVARLKKPILIVDCFSGPGQFDDGELGSPLIIANRLAVLHDKGIPTEAIFIEADPVLAARLSENLKSSSIIYDIKVGSFREFVPLLAQKATSHTIFVYLDPIRPGDLLFDDLASIYECLRLGVSVETLINFLSPLFVRRARGLLTRAKRHEGLDLLHPEVVACNEIAGGTYWQAPVIDPGLSNAERVESIATGYEQHLNRWFQWVLRYPIKEKYGHRVPKYHLLFASRHTDAVELMNRAMVTARRKFVGAQFVEGLLFDARPECEMINHKEIRNILIQASTKLGRCHWKHLRVSATLMALSRYTDSEFNQAIKRAIKDGELKSDATGDRIQENAYVWCESR